jgi:hypothetical protein
MTQHSEPEKTGRIGKTRDADSPLPAFQPWQIAIFTWAFFPGGSTDLAQIDSLLASASADPYSPTGLIGGLRVVQDILVANPSIAPDIEMVRGKIDELMARMKDMRPQWGLSGQMEPNVVLTVSKA